MPVLMNPTTVVHRSFLEAVAEPEYEPSWAENLDLDRLADPAAFAAYVEQLRTMREEEAARASGWVPTTYLWYVDGTEFIGRLSIRHRLTPWLLEYGGHIGYDVRPSARRRGHATAMLGQALPWCLELSIDPVLVTCDLDNVPSRKVIERNGGEFEDRRDGKLRYWIPAS